MRKINIALWGIGQHSVKKILPAITNCKSLNLYGLFSRNKKVLNKNKKKFKCKIWPNHDQMLKDSNIDVVYLSTPIGLHFEQAKKILSFNKHIWIEKSLARNYKEVSQLIALAKRKKKAICEAFMYSYHPQFIYLKDMLNKKSIGNIKKVEIYFGFPHLKKNNWRYNNKLGGAILDNGCYPVSAILKLFSNQIKIIYKNININKNKVDLDGLALLKIQKKIFCYINWGFGYAYRNEIIVWGEKGKLYADKFFSKPNNVNSKIFITKNFKTSIKKFPKANHFELMLNNFVYTINDNKFRKKHYELCLEQSYLISKIKNG